MHVKIQGGKSGVYANTGSCIAAVMYCEHERQELMNKGYKPEAFFHQFSDFVSTSDVISHIDNNKRKLKKKEAKFFVLTVSPSADEQRKMGSTTEERIDAFKNYIRNGVMVEYAKNFERNLSEKDIMYYAYIHINRGEKSGEQMHAHIIVSRKDINNNINLSPNTTYRKGTSFITHGFNRDRFARNCEVSFDRMMAYERDYTDSYEFRKLESKKDYSSISNAAEIRIQQQYQTQLGDIDFGFIAEILGATKTDTPQYETTSESIPVSESVVTETKTPVFQSSDIGIIGLAKKAWSFASGLFGKKTVVPPALEQLKEPQVKEEPKPQMADTEPKPVQPVTTEERKENTNLSIYMSDGKFTLVMTKGETFKSAYIESADAYRMDDALKSGDRELQNKVALELIDKYLKDVSEQMRPSTGKQQSMAQEPGQKKQIPDGLRLFKLREKEHYSAALFKDGKRVRFAEMVDAKDVSLFFKAKNSGDNDFQKKVSDEICTKYFLVPLAKRISDDFLKENKNENITSIRALHGHNGYNWIKYDVDNDWYPGYQIPDRFTDEINSLPTQLVNVMFDALNSLLVDAFPTVACSGTSSKKKRKREEYKGRSR